MGLLLSHILTDQTEMQTQSFSMSTSLTHNTHYLDDGDPLRLCVADDLAEVIARHGEGEAVPVTELGPADLGVRHTLVVHVRDLG